MKLILSLFIFIIISSCSIQRSFDKKIASIHEEIKPFEINEKIPVDKLHKDIDDFINILEEVNVNPYMEISKAEFYKEADNLKKSIKDSLTRKEFYQVFTPLVDLLNDSHTGVQFPKGIWQYNQHVAGGLYFPVEVFTTSEKRLFIKQDYSENNIPQNTEIVSINSIKSENIINTFLKYEHSPVEKSSIKRLEGKFIDFLWWVLDFEGPYIVETNIGTFKVKGQTWTQYKANRKKSNQSNQRTKENIFLNEINDKTCELRISSFSDSPSDFNSQIEEQFKAIKQKGYSNLIIDVRDNGGGNDENGRTVINYITNKPYSETLASKFIRKRSWKYDDYYQLKFRGIIRWMLTMRTATCLAFEARQFKSYLKKPYGTNDTIILPLKEPKENPLRFTGHVYVLSNYNSYSAATTFLGAIKDYGLGTIIGTESGDNPTGYGNRMFSELSNTRLLCYFSTTFMIRPSGDTDMSHGVKPDYIVEQTMEDTEKNADKSLEYTLKLIN